MAPDRVKIPSVVMAELLVGVEKSENPREKAKEINQFLNPYEIIPFGAEAAVFYSKIRADLEERGLPMGPNDLMIAATVMAHDGILVTHNVKEFRRVRHLVIEDWVE
ncbi:MAG: PIN domain-containing protein [Chlamydiae bacterium]|nr:PIN domain-containing protein [Chlamydiota bacterium]MBI3266527.1 PIN domain-containing protein [Chlamydiota bacterium]